MKTHKNDIFKKRSNPKNEFAATMKSPQKMGSPQKMKLAKKKNGVAPKIDPQTRCYNCNKITWYHRMSNKS